MALHAHVVSSPEWRTVNYVVFGARPDARERVLSPEEVGIKSALQARVEGSYGWVPAVAWCNAQRRASDLDTSIH